MTLMSWSFISDVLDQIPKLLASQGINAGGRFIQISKDRDRE
jgi:hypothetical protein